MEAHPDPQSPQEPESSRGLGTRIVLLVLTIASALVVVAWLAPDLVRLAGMPRLAWRLSHDGLLRFVLGIFVFVMFLASHVVSTSSRFDSRARVRRNQAAALGGEVVASRSAGPHAFADGPDLQLSVGDQRSVMISTVVERSGHAHHTCTRAFVAFASRDLFSFQAVGMGHATRTFGSITASLMRGSIEKSLQKAKTEAERQSIRAVEYLCEPPIAKLPVDLVGRCQLRSNEPVRAMAVLSSPGVLAALDLIERESDAWEWTFFPTKPQGQVEMTLTVPGRAESGTIQGMQQLMAAALSAIDQASAA